MVTTTNAEFDLRMAKHLKDTLDHIKLVQSNAEKLATRLIEQGEGDFAVTLIANCLRHDASKFHGIEWKYLTTIDSTDPAQKEKLIMAHGQHVATNEHHPEYWAGGIKEMPRIFVAEMVCDWYARSQERGTSLWDFVKQTAVDRFEIKYQSKTWKWIKEFIDLLIDPPFADLTKPTPTKKETPVEAK